MYTGSQHVVCYILREQGILYIKCIDMRQDGKFRLERTCCFVLALESPSGPFSKSSFTVAQYKGRLIALQ